MRLTLKMDTKMYEITAFRSVNVLDFLSKIFVVFFAGAAAHHFRCIVRRNSSTSGYVHIILNTNTSQFLCLPTS